MVRPGNRNRVLVFTRPTPKNCCQRRLTATRATSGLSVATSQLARSSRVGRLGGFFRKIVDFHARWLRQALAHPGWLAGLSLLLVAASYVCYRYSGSDLMPEMDEGGFTLDYWTPAGTSLAETDRMVRPHGTDPQQRA